MKAQWWYASQDFANGPVKLVSPTVAGSEEREFQDAQPVTITVEGAFVATNMDGSFLTGENDIVLATRHRVGNRPIVDKVHFLRSEVPADAHIGPFFHPVVYATEDFRADEAEVTLQVRIYDEDGLGSAEAEVLTKAISGAAGSAAVAFPSFAPFAGLSSDAGGALLTLVDTLDDHDRLVDATIRLAIGKPADRGHDLFQPGFLIAFDGEVDASSLVLDADKRLYLAEGGASEPFRESSYAVLRVQRDFLPAPDLELDEKAATLLAEIERGKGAASGQALTFLRETFDAYSKFRKLERVRDLRARGAELAKEGKELSKAEGELLKKLSADSELAAFLGAA